MRSRYLGVTSIALLTSCQTTVQIIKILWCRTLLYHSKKRCAVIDHFKQSIGLHGKIPQIYSSIPRSIRLQESTDKSSRYSVPINRHTRNQVDYQQINGRNICCQRKNISCLWQLCHLQDDLTIPCIGDIIFIKANTICKISSCIATAAVMFQHLTF